MTKLWASGAGRYSKPLIASLLAASALAFAVAYGLSGPQSFGQLAMGFLAGSGLSKAGELAAALAFMLALPVAWFAFGGPVLTARPASDGPADWLLFFLLGVPAAILAGQAISMRSLAAEWVPVVLVCAVHWVTQTAVQARAAHLSDGSNGQARAAALAVPPLVAFSCVGICTLWSRIAPFPQHIPAWPVALISASVAYAVWSTREGSLGSRARNRSLSLSQAGVPLLALGMVPTPVVAPFDTFTSTSPALWCLVAAVALVGIIDVARRADRTAFAERLSPVCVLLIVWSVRNPFTPFPTLPSDDWHFGEVLLPYWSYVDHGLIPYIDLMPVRGFVSGANAMAAELLFAGNADDVFRAAGVVAFALMAIVFLPAYAAAGIMPAAFVAGLLSQEAKFPIGQPDYFYLAAFYAVLAALVRQRYVTALVVTSGVLIALTLLSPGHALIFAAAATAPAFFSIIQLRKNSQALAVGVLSAATLLALGLFLLQQSGLLGGMYKYVADNASVNTIGHGVAWYGMLHVGSITVGLIRLEMLRAAVLPITGAVIVIAVSAIHHLRLSARRLDTRAGTGDLGLTLVIAAFIILTVGLTLPRALGRVDAAIASRLGQLTLLVVAGLLPTLVLRVVTQRQALVPLGLCVIGAVGINAFMGTPIRSDVLLNGQYQVNPAGPVTDGSNAGLHRVGHAVMDPQHLHHVRRLKLAVDELLAGEPAESSASPRSKPTYYDMTNRNAHYAYLGRPPPTLWSSPYYLADERAQSRTAQELVSRNVPLVLLSADNIEHDGGGASLRAYWLYRTILQHYIPFRSGGFIFAVKRDYAGKPPFADRLPESEAAIQALFEEVFAVTDLRSAPASWGASVDRLQGRMTAESVDITEAINPAAGGTPANDINKEIRTSSPGVRRFDLLVLALTCDRPTNAVFAWQTGPAGSALAHSTQFAAQTGTLIVPMGSFPSWIMGPAVTSLSLNAPACKVRHAELRRRMPPEPPTSDSQKTRSSTRNR